jgi:hypothetical protein
VQVAGAAAERAGGEMRLCAAHSITPSATGIAPTTRSNCNEPMGTSRASCDDPATVGWTLPWTGGASLDGMVVRLLPQLVAQHPSIGCGWHHVMERNPGALTPEPGADRVWVLVAGRPRLLPRTILEFWDGDPG